MFTCILVRATINLSYSSLLTAINTKLAPYVLTSILPILSFMSFSYKVWRIQGVMFFFKKINCNRCRRRGRKRGQVGMWLRSDRVRTSPSRCLLHGADPAAWAAPRAEGTRGLPHVPVPDVWSNQLLSSPAMPIPSAYNTYCSILSTLRIRSSSIYDVAACDWGC